MSRRKYSVRIDEQLDVQREMCKYYCHVYQHRWYGKWEIDTFFASTTDEARKRADQIIRKHARRDLTRTEFEVRL